MPRRPRIVAGGYPMQVILRGIDRSAVCFEESDYRFFLECLRLAAAEEEVAVHAYVPMASHVHLLMTAAGDQGVPRVMKRLGQRYVQHVNRTYRRTGGLFEGRFRSSLIEADNYLLACQRYIELNPVRTAMVSGPDDCPWSSYRANALGVADALVTPNPIYHALAAPGTARFAAYRGLFESELNADRLQRLRECTNGGFVLGSSKFEQQVASMVGGRTWRGAPGRPRKQESDTKQGELPL